MSINELFLDPTVQKLSYLVLGQLVIGKLAKTHPGIENAKIPFITWLTAALGIPLSGAAGPDASVTDVAALSGVVTMVTTGLHSLGKNAALPLLKALFNVVKGVWRG